MGQILHGSATTTEAVHRAIQHSQESLRTLAKRYGVNQKTVAKWRKRTSVADLRTGPKEPHSTVLSPEEEALIVAFRRYTLLPLDDCLYALQPTIPHLTRSSLHRCLQRYGISRLPDVEGERPAKKKFKSYPIGYFHIDIAELRTEQGKLHMFVAIDRTSKFAFVELHEKATTAVARECLLRLIAAVPYKIHTVLTDNGIQFTTPGAGGSAVPLIKEAIARESCSGPMPSSTPAPAMKLSTVRCALLAASSMLPNALRSAVRQLGERPTVQVRHRAANGELRE
jgi:Integrase core domain